MPRPKKIIEKFEEGEQVSTQELVKAYDEPVIESAGYIVMADFDNYQVGDVFALPDGWTKDEAFQPMKFSEVHGIAFLRPDGKRVILPLKEA